jgi:hypothetical protein
VTETESAILEQLRNLDATAARRGDVLSILTELTRLTRSLPPDADPDLLHYLNRRSYEKARLFLEGIDPETGTCRH